MIAGVTREPEAVPGFDPLCAEFVADPFPTLAQLRGQRPLFHAPALGCWVVTRYEDIVRVLDDPGTFSAAEAQRPLHPMCPRAAEILVDLRLVPTMSNCDPPEHQRYRSVMSRAMSPRRMARLTPAIQERASALLDRFADGLRADLVRELFYPLPASTIFTLIGFPPGDSDRIRTWCADKLEVNWGRPTEEQQIGSARGMVEFFRYCADFVALRRAAPANDLTSDLIADERNLADPEITSLIFALSFAGHETTTNLLGNAVYHLLSRPAVWDEIRADRSLVPGAVEETLRFDSSVPAWRRVTTRDTVLGGLRLPAGSRLVLSFAAADRQPEVFEQPDHFDIRRPNARRQLSFGRGIHLCLGAGLARTECEIVLNLLADRLAGLRLVRDQEIRFPANLSFRGPVTLWAQWDSDRSTDLPG